MCQQPNSRLERELNEMKSNEMKWREVNRRYRGEERRYSADVVIGVREGEEVTHWNYTFATRGRQSRK